MAASENPVIIATDTDFPLAGGLQARRWQLRGTLIPTTEIITVLNGYTVIIAGLGDETRIDAIAASLRPLATSP
jgi:hypothetical protein